MELLTNQILAGIATGSIYACMALSVVMIYQAIDHLNFAQGEMATFSAFVAWQLMRWGIPYLAGLRSHGDDLFRSGSRYRTRTVPPAGECVDTYQRRRIYRVVCDRK